MELQVINTDGQAVNTVSLADATFAGKFNEPLVHQVLVAYWSGGRAGTRAQKTRSEVRGGGAKPWRQKGTGRARAGTTRGPLWRGGGVTFAAKPRDYSQKVNKKMYRAAMRSLFAELLRQERLVVVDQLSLSEPKTKLMLSALQTLGIVNGALVVTETGDERNLLLAARNLFNVEVSSVAGLNPDSLVRFDKVLITQAALERVGSWLA